MRLIDADALIEDIDGDLTDSIAEGRAIEKIMNAPTIDAVPVKLTFEEINTIRIHMNAFKEKLCNQHRYKEADEYQQIVDKLDTMMDAEREEE